MFKDIPGARDRIQSARSRNFNIKFVYFRAPEFVLHLETRLRHLSSNTGNSIYDIIIGGLIKETGEYTWTEQFQEKQTLKALANFMQEEKMMACLRRVYMSKASKYVNPENGMMTDGGRMTDKKCLVI